MPGQNRRVYIRKPPDLDDVEKSRRGAKLAEVFQMLRMGPDRWQTTWGHKTGLGIYHVAQRLLEEGK